MERRGFLKQVATWSAVAGTVPFLRLPESAHAEAAATSPGGPTVFVGKGADYAAVTRNVIEKIGGMAKFVKPGDKVVVKPNIGWDRKPEQAANTNPLVVKTIVELALAAGAKQVLVFDRTCNDMRRCYANSGIKEAVESLKDPRATCPYIDNARFVPVKVESGKALTEWELYKDALDADCYINVPIAKHHGSAKLTLSMKNIMGVCGGNRGTLHQQQGEKLTDLNLIIRPKLIVLDATRILLRSGPQGGKLEDVKQLDTVMASTDPVAIDAYATTLFGMKPEQIPITVAAAKRGLGEIDLAKITITEV